MTTDDTDAGAYEPDPTPCGLLDPETGKGPCELRAEAHPPNGRHWSEADGTFWVDPKGPAAARTHYGTLEEALRAFGVVDGAVVRRLKDLEEELQPVVDGTVWPTKWHYWTPPSMSYVAIGRESAFGGTQEVAAYVHKTMARDSEGNVLATFGDAGPGRARTAHAARPVQTCPTCSMALPATGVCDYCA